MLAPGLSHPVQVLDIVPKVPRAGIEPATRSDSRHKSLALELTLASCCQESPLGTRRSPIGHQDSTTAAQHRQQE